MANVDAVRLSNELGIDLAHAMLRLRREGRPGESNHDTCLRIIADEVRKPQTPKRDTHVFRTRPAADGTVPLLPPTRARHR
ncbi:hypothetical protein [Nocardia brasiliensis]|uniref:Uncharacterized protein n=1 Tax=Nocardia brasiliensis (strain ATCC 700358 / HUJEG-1) TaxID=1133849 RepID=K0F5H1_NOCB7|nr:hypothetical protein [Nocardia brasiliensis]AFU04957.1 hypothetical protein O3I_035050 [Nocardia brasiliensis ATCC 700358]OCF85444.1 hypothetical protein AW168_36265 [Nocardia brasiliensis]